MFEVKITIHRASFFKYCYVVEDSAEVDKVVAWGHSTTDATVEWCELETTRADNIIAAMTERL